MIQCSFRILIVPSFAGVINIFILWSFCRKDLLYAIASLFIAASSQPSSEFKSALTNSISIFLPRCVSISFLIVSAYSKFLTVPITEYFFLYSSNIICLAIYPFAPVTRIFSFKVSFIN